MAWHCARNLSLQFIIGVVMLTGVACGGPPTTPTAAAPDVEIAQVDPQPTAVASRPATTGTTVQPAPPNLLTPTEARALLVEGLERISKFKDYSCQFVKRERVGGKLTDYDHISMKLRHEPFSVYMHFDQPSSKKGQEALYVAGQNNSKLIAHGAGLQKTLLGTMQLDPTGSTAMSGNRHPITSAGLKNLLEKVLRNFDKDPDINQLEFRKLEGGKVDGRPCWGLQISTPTRRGTDKLAAKRIYFDNELGIPVRYELYEWPAEAGEPPFLAEEYTYLKVQFDNGLEDQDFDPKNAKYQFK